MSDIDDKIREALKDSHGSEELFEDQGLFAEAMAPLRGKRKWELAIAVFFSFVGLAVAIWAGFRFYDAELVREQLIWGGVSLLGFLTISFIKVYFWMEMHTHRILREVKRVELMVLEKKNDRSV